ncbi:hypothetical protein ACFE04_030383 [Oxalis oulophora]
MNALSASKTLISNPLPIVTIKDVHSNFNNRFVVDELMVGRCNDLAANERWLWRRTASTEESMDDKFNLLTARSSAEARASVNEESITVKASNMKLCHANIAASWQVFIPLEGKVSTAQSALGSDQNSNPLPTGMVSAEARVYCVFGQVCCFQTVK